MIGFSCSTRWRPKMPGAYSGDVRLTCPLVGGPVLLRAFIGTINRFAKLRRSAISIAASSLWSFSKLRRRGMFVRRFIQSLALLSRFDWDHEPLKRRIPKEFRLKAQGCRACEATLETRVSELYNPNGVAPIRDPQFMQSRLVNLPTSGAHQFS